ncbi:hypothetical protein [Cellulomonas composti]|uniref:Uncharacterized protein n=1 Tax=Cellulomonas composti TaxID=266130 RepID=A0A511J9M7_9CELL|nr:hypothetical protein [Cellulomonas composti]GEL94459.1 hypothetical protein CCO02nite_11170 [Cellulomonas composti]
MGLFSRRTRSDEPASRPGGSGSSAPASGSAPGDATAWAPGGSTEAKLPPLTSSDAHWLRAHAVAAFARAGFVDPVAGDDHVRTAEGIYGLANLARVLPSYERSDWSALVDEHVHNLATARERTLPSSVDEVADQLVARVLSVLDLPHDDPAAGPRLGPDLVVRAAIDYPETIALLWDGAALGGWAVTGAPALAGLRRLPAPAYRHEEHDVHVFLADDFFGASRVLLLDDLLASVGAPAPTHGVLVAVPDRTCLLVHVPRDSTVVAAVQLMIGIARSRQSEPGPLSPHVYFRAQPGAELTPITRDTGSGVHVVVDGPFAEAMAALGLIG